MISPPALCRAPRPIADAENREVSQACRRGCDQGHAVASIRTMPAKRAPSVAPGVTADAANGRHATETTPEAAEWGKHGRAPDAPRLDQGRAERGLPPLYAKSTEPGASAPGGIILPRQ